MNQITKVLSFFRVIDSFDGQLSLTNCALIVVLQKLVIVPAMGFQEIGALFVALLSYQGKKIINGKSAADIESKVDETTRPLAEQLKQAHTRMDEMQSHVSALSLKAGLNR